LHETNEKYENLNSMKSHLHYYHTTYYHCSYVVNSVHEYFAVADSHFPILQHQARLIYENFTQSYHSYTTLLPQNILQLRYIFVAHITASTIWGLQKLGLIGIVGYTTCSLFLNVS